MSFVLHRTVKRVVKIMTVMWIKTMVRAVASPIKRLKETWFKMQK